MHRDKTLAYVQTRWAFSNGNESFLTWAQVGSWQGLRLFGGMPLGHRLG